MQAIEKSGKPPMALNIMGLLGVSLWVLTIFLRETSVINNPAFHFWLGIAPNFGVGLLLPMLLVQYYSATFKKTLTYKQFLVGLAVIFAALFMSEVVHALFLNSGFDIFDLLASLVALSIMAWLYRTRQ